MTTQAVVRAHGLQKKRGNKQVLEDLSLQIPEGRVLGLVGPNGAGKTTTIKILLGMLAPDAGSTHIFGEPSMQLSIGCRQRIGYLSEESVYENLPIVELLEFHSHFFEAWDWGWCRHLIDKMRVAKDKTLYDMSKGERRKAELLMALAHKPDLLILDDPAVGLDVTVRRDILWATLETAKQEGKTIIFTSHILQDVERVVDDVLILDQGKVRLSGGMEDLKARTKRLVLVGVDGTDPLPGEIRRKQHGRDLVVVTDQFSPELEAGLRKRCPGLQVEDMNLEDIFCEVIGDQEA